MFAIAQPRPPFIEFKQVAVQDMVKTLELGYRCTKDVDFAFIMQPGSKDCVEVEAVTWLDNIKRRSLEGEGNAYPLEWVDAFKKKYEMWKAGNEAPLNGTSVKEWPVLSPSQVQNFLALNILTIEDVAAMTEEALARFGMGSRELRDKAREWTKGKEVSDAAMKENGELKTRIADLEAKLEQLLAGNVVEKPRRGRKPKED